MRPLAGGALGLPRNNLDWSDAKRDRTAGRIEYRYGDRFAQPTPG
ncbi:MAG TPA: hypothetical protein VF929_04480 [Gemmatimonadaceae bacterium]